MTQELFNAHDPVLRDERPLKRLCGEMAIEEVKFCIRSSGICFSGSAAGAVEYISGQKFEIFLIAQLLMSTAG